MYVHIVVCMCVSVCAWISRTCWTHCYRFLVLSLVPAGELCELQRQHRQVQALALSCGDGFGQFAPQRQQGLWHSTGLEAEVRDGRRFSGHPLRPRVASEIGFVKHCVNSQIENLSFNSCSGCVLKRCPISLYRIIVLKHILLKQCLKFCVLKHGLKSLSCKPPNLTSNCLETLSCTFAFRLSNPNPSLATVPAHAGHR